MVSPTRQTVKPSPPSTAPVPDLRAFATDTADPQDGPEVLSVGELNRRVKHTLEGTPTLRGVHVRGEVSNCRPHRNGHLYFTLKQDGAAVDCVMWSSFMSKCPEEFRDGLEVVALADVSLYEAWGKYQLLVREIQPAGEGLLWLRLAAMKKKLQAEGLFEASRKRRLPYIPQTIGVVTSQSGAALHDILNVLQRRAPYLKVIVADARVQGDGAAASIVSGIERMARADIDVIIVGRGGGSLEDLWAFNEEAVVRAVAACPVPIISAVGHETDNPLSDLAADLRCPTPSAAAESVAPSMDELIQHLDAHETRMARNLHSRLEVARHRYERLASRPLFVRPDGLLEPLGRRITDIERRLPHAMSVRLERTRSRLGEQAARLPRSMTVRLDQTHRRLDDHARRLPVALTQDLRTRQNELRRAAGMLDALSPLKVLARGYAVPTKDGHGVQRVADVAVGDALELRLVDGRIHTVVKDKEVTKDGRREE